MTHARVPVAVAVAAALGLLAPHVSMGQVAVDEDGAVRAPSAGEATALAAAMADSLSQSDHGLSERKLPDGAVVLDLQGRFESLSVARVVDGQVVTGCVTSPAEAEAFAAPTQQPPAAER